MTDATPSSTAAQLPDFDELCDLLLAQRATTSAAELHGLLCGQLCGGVRLDSDSWLRKAAQWTDIETPDNALKVQLVNLYEASLRQLEASAFDFELLLPDEMHYLNDRVQALAHWCNGFLSGLGSAGQLPQQGLSQEILEALKDMARIAQLKEAVEDSDDNEADLFELSDYVRMAAMMLFTECHPGQPQVRPDSPDSPSIH